jgi:hypothetical protein
VRGAGKYENMSQGWKGGGAAEGQEVEQNVLNIVY